jgi:hypothetical protein
MATALSERCGAVAVPRSMAPGGASCMGLSWLCVRVSQSLIDWELGSRARALNPSELAKAINDVRTSCSKVSVD